MKGKKMSQKKNKFSFWIADDGKNENTMKWKNLKTHTRNGCKIVPDNKNKNCKKEMKKKLFCDGS